MNITDQFGWADQYAEYIQMKKRGLKKQAQTSLHNFIKDFRLQQKNERRQFIDSIYSIANKADEYSLYLPYNLSHDVFDEEIYNWIKEEPSNPVPYKWSGNFELMRKAVEMNPLDQETILLFGKILANRIGMNQHELKAGFGYTGNPVEDLELINFFKSVVNNIVDEVQRKLLVTQLKELENDASKYTQKSTTR